MLTYYGPDHQIDGVVLDVLLRKRRTIRSSLGISIPVPADTETVLTALMHGSLLRGSPQQLALDFARTEARTLHTEWEAAGEREKRSRTMFAQHAIKPEEVADELEAVQRPSGLAWRSRSSSVLLRARFHLVTKRGATEQALLAEDWQPWRTCC